MQAPYTALIITTLAGLACGAFMAPGLARDCSLLRGLREPARSSSNAQGARELGPGAALDQEISGGGLHSYRIALIEGQYLRVVVRGNGIDLTVSLREPGGEIAVERSRYNRLQPAMILTLARTSGAHHLLVIAPGQKGLRGRYTIKIEELRDALPEDHQRVAADRLLAEGKRLRGQGKTESYGKALEKFEESLSKWRAIGDRLGEAETFNFMGSIHGVLGDNRKALDCYDRALPLYRAEGDRLNEAATLGNIAFAHFALGEIKTSLDLSTQALHLHRELGDRQGEAAALNNIGAAYQASGDALLALDYYKQTLPLRRDFGDLTGEARTLNNIGIAYSDLGENLSALENHLKALLLWRRVNDRSGEATTLSNIGVAYYNLGEPQKTLDYNQQAIPLKQSVGDRDGLAHTLSNIASAYTMLGDEQKALDYQQQALSIFREVGNRRREAHMLTHIGWIYNRLGDYQKALDHLGQALPICRMVGDRRGEATAHQGLGRVYGEWGAGRDFDKSIEHYRQALAIQRAIKSPQDEAQSLLGMARVELERGILTEARESVETALGIIESQRAKISVQDLRASYLATNQDFYEFYIDLLMAMRRNLPPEVAAGYEAAALEANERRLARTLLDSLIEARADIRQGIDPQLIAEERALRQRINAKEAHRTRLLSGERAQDHAAVENELNDMEARYQNIQAQIRASSPHYASLTQPTTLNLRDIQRQTLDDDTLLLEYALGKERSFLWTVTGNSFASYELPRRETIETAAQRFYKLLNLSYQRQYKRESELASGELSRMLLGPVASQLGKKRLLIVADGALQYVPFAALPTPEAKGKGDGAMGRKEKPRPVAPRVSRPVAFTPLIVNHEIVNLPSASTLAALRRELVGRQPAARTVAVLADPVLQAGDARVKQSGAGAMIEPGRTPASSMAGDAEADDPIRSAGESGALSLERLPFTRQEAETILTLAGDGKSFKALDFNASLATATSPELAEYRIVHFATHGLINSQRPQLSGIVLSLVNEQGRPQDGFLRMHDIYNLRFGAELVVLSACQTALGKRVKGEGLVGLVRGFMHAGAPRVAASLWNVRDEATAELMKRFYEKMLKDGLPPAAALRAAQVSMWKEKRWEAPYYWAGFALQGEWK